MLLPPLDQLGLPALLDPSLLPFSRAELLRAHQAASSRGLPLLTQAGVLYLTQGNFPPEDCLDLAGPAGPAFSRSESHEKVSDRPYWDAQARRLWLGDVLLKTFCKQRAENQTLLLTVFQEQNWDPALIDDPLPLAKGETAEDGKRRLRYTIRDLNRGLLPDTIRFRGDGTGQRIIWYSCKCS